MQIYFEQIKQYKEITLQYLIKIIKIFLLLISQCILIQMEMIKKYKQNKKGIKLKEKFYKRNISIILETNLNDSILSSKE